MPSSIRKQIRNKSLFFVSAAATSAFQLEQTSRLLRSTCTGGYRIRTIEYGKILVMLVYGEYYGCVYEVYKYLLNLVRLTMSNQFFDILTISNYQFHAYQFDRQSPNNVVTTVLRRKTRETKPLVKF